MRKPQYYFLLSEASHILFVNIWFLCKARSASVFSVVQLIYAQREMNEEATILLSLKRSVS